MPLMNPDLTGLGADQLRQLLEESLMPYGWGEAGSQVRVSPVREYGIEGWKTMPGEYDVAIAHGSLEGMGTTWRGTVSGGPNQTLKVKQGAGHQLFIGDLFTVTEQGLPTTNAAPYYTGLQSFARRVSAAFGLKAQEGDSFSRDTIMDKFRQVNAVETAGPSPYKDPLGRTMAGRIPATNVRLEPTTSPGELHFQSHTYNVPIGTQDPANPQQIQGAVAALHAQVRTLGAGGIQDPFYSLHQGGVFEPGTKTGGRFIAPAAVGSQYGLEGGSTQLAALTEKFLKQTYVAGRREIGTPSVMTGQSITPLPQEYLRTSTLSLRGEGGITGMPVRAMTSIHDLPWQSGEMQFNLPKNIREYVTGQQGRFLVGRQAVERMPVYTDVNLSNLGDVAKYMPEVAFNKFGRTLPRGGIDPVTLMKGVPDQGIDPVTYSTGQQYEQINRMSLILPTRLGEGMTKTQVQPHFQSLIDKGFHAVRFGAVEQPQIELGMTVGTMAGPKMGAAKGQVNLPLEGVVPQLRTGGGAVGYDVLQEAKSSDALMLNVLQALESEGRGRAASFVQTLMPDMPDISTQMGISKMSLEDVGLASGKFETGQHLLEQLTTRMINYGDQEGLRKQFGVGLVEGRVPLQQWTPETFRDYRRQFLETAMRRSMFEGGQPDMSPLEARQAWRQTVGRFTEFTPDAGPGGQGLYTFWQPGQFLQHPKLQTFVQETGGLGSQQYEVELGLRAQGQGEIADWLMQNQNRVTPSTPARWAIQQASRGWSATVQERVTDPAYFRRISPEQAESVMQTVAGLEGDEYRGKIGAVRAYREAFRNVLGLGAQDPEPVMWFSGQKTAMFGPQAALELESRQLELRREGLDVTSQSRVVERYTNSMIKLLEAEATGTTSRRGRYLAEQLQANYLDSDQLRKMRGGVFTRAGGSGLVPTGQTFMHREAMEKFYLQQGGRGVGASDEWRRYLNTMRDVAVVGERYPAPNVGSEGMPGSIYVSQLLTPQSRIGSHLQSMMDRSGIQFPDLTISTQQVASQGDVDLDPYSFFPLAFRTEGGKWNRFSPSQAGGDAGAYQKWLREDIVPMQSTRQQQKTFDIIYGAGQGKFNPFGSSMSSYINRMMGADVGGGLLEKRLSLQAEGVQDAIEQWNQHKVRGMGSTYNAFLRRTDVGAALLGLPERPAAFARDVVIPGYQHELDFEKFTSSYQSMLQSAGLFQSDTDVNKGVMLGFFNKDKFAEGGWSIGQDVRKLGSLMGGMLSQQTGATPELVASLVQQIPKRGDMPKEDFSRMVEERRTQIADALRPVMENRDQYSGVGYRGAINKVLGPMTQGNDPLVGERSIGVMSLLSRIFEYSGRDAERMAQVEDVVNEAGGFTVAGRKVPFQDVAAEARPFTTMYAFARNVKGTKLEKAFYKDPTLVGEALLRASQEGNLESPIMRQLARTWGEISGFTPAEGGGVMFTDPLTGQPTTAKTTSDFSGLMQAWQERIMQDPYQGVKDLVGRFPLTGRPGGERLRASSLGNIGAQFPDDPAMRELTKQGSIGHKYIAEYVRGAGFSDVRGVEQQMRGAIPGLTGTIDLLRSDPEGLTLYDWKSGTTPTEEYHGQMAGYAAGSGAQRAFIGRFSREHLQDLRRQTLGAARQARLQAGVQNRQPLSHYQGAMGELLYNQAMGNLEAIPAAALSASALEQRVRQYGQAEGIQLEPRPAVPQSSGVGGQPPANVGGGGVTIGGDEPPDGGDDDPEYQRYLRWRQSEGMYQEAQRGEQQPQGRPLVFRGRPRGHTLQKGIHVLKAFGDIERSIGTFSERGDFQPGRMMQTSGDIPRHLAQMFPLREQQQRILGAEGFEGALSTAQDIASEQGYSLKKMIAQSPQLGYMTQAFQRLEPQFRRILGFKGDFPQELKQGKGEGLYRVIQATAGDTSVSEGASAMMHPGVGAGLGAMYTKAELLTEAQRKGSQGFLPLNQRDLSIAEDWVKLLKDSTGEIEKQTKSLLTFKGEVKDMQDVLDQGLRGEKGAQVQQRIGTAQRTRLQAERMAAGLRETAGMDARRGMLTARELRQISVDPSTDLKKFESYVTKAESVPFRDLQAIQAARDVPISGEGPGMDARRLSRRMLGGFGLMYIRSIGGIMAGGLTQGYQENLAQQQAVLAGMGQMGGAPPQFTPDERLAQAQAMYGGAGWAALQNARAQATRDPFTQGLMGAGQAAVGAGGLALTLGLWGAPITGPMAAGLAGAAALGQQAISTYGAYTETEQTGVGMATRMMTATPEERARYFGQARSIGGTGVSAPDTLGERFMNWFRGGTIPNEYERMVAGHLERPLDTQFAGWAASPEAQELTRRLTAIEERGEDVSVRQAIRDMGYRDIGAQELEAQYWQARSQAPDISVGAAGFIGAAQLQERYGIQMDLPQQQFLAGAIMQQAPWVQAAQQFGAMPYRTREQQEAMAGQFLDTFSSEGGRTQEQIEVLVEGYQRLVGLDMYGPQATTQEQQEALQRQLGTQFTQQGYDLMREQYSMGAERRRMGLFWQPPVWEQYMGQMTPEFIEQQQRANQVQMQQTQALGQVFQGFTGLGMTDVDMRGFEDYSLGELAQITNVQQMAGQIQGVLPTAGWTRDAARQAGQAFANVGARDPRHARMLFGMGQGDQQAWARYMMNQPQAFQQMFDQYRHLQGRGGSLIDMSMMGMVDVSPEGAMTGLPWGSTSLATPFQSSQAMATRIWGEGYQGRAGLSQGMIGAMVEGGTFGGQLWQQQQAAAQQQAQAGLQLEQLQLTRAFQTGVGIGGYSGITNPQTGQPFGFHTGRFGVNVRGVGGFTTEGGGLWGAQDAMRGLGWMQQEWNFGRQRDQLQMQDRFWQENFNLNRRGAMMQRPWRREDWRYQDQQRAMQWAWRQEDFQEEQRFMTGRDRRLGERQMARETIMYGLEGEQIDKQRERQEDLWKLEDERFMIQEAQHREQLKFTEEGIKVQERFYEERKRLEQEQVKLTRAYYTEQMKLQEQQIKASAAYARTQQEIAQTMLEFRQESEKLMAQGGLFNEDTWAGLVSIMSEIDPQLAQEFWDLFMKQMDKALDKADRGTTDNDQLGNDDWRDDDASDDDGTGPPPGGHPDHQNIPEGTRRQHGGRVVAGMDYVVGEAGTEAFRPYFTGDVLPTYKTNPWESTMLTPRNQGKESQLIQLILNLGGDYFREFILNTVDSEIDV